VVDEARSHLNTRYVTEDYGLSEAAAAGDPFAQLLMDDDKLTEAATLHEIQTAVGNAIRAVYEYAGHSQSSLGNSIGVSQGNISDWVRGARMPSLDRLLDIESACGVPHGFLLKQAGLLELSAVERETPLHGYPHPPTASLLSRAQTRLDAAHDRFSDAQDDLHAVQQAYATRASLPPDASPPADVPDVDEGDILDAQRTLEIATKVRDFYVLEVARLADGEDAATPASSPESQHELTPEIAEAIGNKMAEAGKSMADAFGEQLVDSLAPLREELADLLAAMSFGRRLVADAASAVAGGKDASLGEVLEQLDAEIAELRSNKADLPEVHPEDVPIVWRLVEVAGATVPEGFAGRDGRVSHLEWAIGVAANWRSMGNPMTEQDVERLHQEWLEETEGEQHQHVAAVLSRLNQILNEGILRPAK
jgi:transcriptional regulator with XRE-family HTH domain